MRKLEAGCGEVGAKKRGGRAEGDGTEKEERAAYRRSSED